MMHEELIYQTELEVPAYYLDVVDILLNPFILLQGLSICPLWLHTVFNTLVMAVNTDQDSRTLPVWWQHLKDSSESRGSSGPDADWGPSGEAPTPAYHLHTQAKVEQTNSLSPW